MATRTYIFNHFILKHTFLNCRPIFVNIRRHTKDDDDVTEIITLDPDSDGESSIKRRRAKNRSKPSTSNGVGVDDAGPSNIEKAVSQEQQVSNFASFLISDLHPMSMLDDNGFRQFVAQLDGDYDFPSKDGIETQLSLMYELVRSKLEDELKTAPFVSLSAEIWQTYTARSYATFRVYFIDNEWEPHANVLSTCRLSDTDTSGQLNIRMHEVASNWGIQDKITSVTYDSPQNADKERGPSIICLAESLERCINSAVKANPVTNRLLEKCQALLDHFDESTTAEVYLFKYQNYLEIPTVSLRQDDDHQFNSQYNLLKAMLAQKTAIESVMSDRDATKSTTANVIQLSSDEWTLMGKIVAVLRPFECAKTVMFGSPKKGAASVIKPLVHTFCENFLDIGDAEEPATVSLKMSIRDELLALYKMYYDSKDVDIDQPEFLDVATYLDPRYKNQSYLSDRHRINVWQHVSQAIQIKLRGSNGETTPKEKPKTRRSAYDYLFPSTSTGSKSTVQLHDECLKYNLEPEIGKNLSIYKWWAMRDDTYPLLSIEAKKYLCGKAVSKPIYAFEKFHSRRAVLSPRHIDKFLFIHNNIDH